MTEEELADLNEQEWGTIETSTADCMSASGFTYFPRPFPGVDATLTRPGSDQTFGYADDFEMRFVGNPTAVTTNVDPNRSIVDALSDAERIEWRSRLEGEELAIDPLTSTADVADQLVNTDREPGCRRAAGDEVRARSTRNQVAIDEYREAMSALPADHRVVAAQDVWAECMASGGYPYSDAVAIHQSLGDELSDIYFMTNDLPFDNEGRRVLSPEVVEEADKLRALETDIRLVYDKCEADLAAVREEVRVEIEAEFVDGYNAG